MYVHTRTILYTEKWLNSTCASFELSLMLGLESCSLRLEATHLYYSNAVVICT